MEFLEFEALGFNCITIGFLGALSFGFISLWALYKQGSRIWQNKSAQTASGLYFSYMTFMTLVSIIYALFLKSFLMLFNNAISGLLMLPILLGIKKFKGFEKKVYYLMPVYLGLLVFMASVSFKGLLLIIFCFGAYSTMIMQIIEIYKEKSAGQLEIKLFITYWLSTMFWILYATGVGDWALRSLCLINISLLTITIGMILKYPNKDSQKIQPTKI